MAIGWFCWFCCGFGLLLSSCGVVAEQGTLKDNFLVPPVSKMSCGWVGLCGLRVGQGQSGVCELDDGRREVLSYSDMSEHEQSMVILGPGTAIHLDIWSII